MNLFDQQPMPLASPDLSKYSTTKKDYVPMNQAGYLDLDAEDMDLLADVVDDAGLLAVQFSEAVKAQAIALCDSVLLDLFVLGYHARLIRVCEASLDQTDGRLQLYFTHHADQKPIHLN